MSWMQMLVDTYDYAISNGGIDNSIRPLPPKGFIVENINYEVTLSAEGEFVDVSEISKENQDTLIPCTPESGAARGSPVKPHPLFDKVKILGEEDQMELLSRWCSSGVPDTVSLIFNYLKNGTLHEDIARTLKTKKAKFDDNAKARFIVADGNSPLDLWRRKEFIISWQTFYETLIPIDMHDLCYVTGQKAIIATKHPFAKKSAMLISMGNSVKDNNIGRFSSNAQCAVAVSLDAAMKAHNMRKWLMANQGRYFFDTESVLWDTRGFALPDIWSYGAIDDEEGEDEPVVETGVMLANTINKASWGVWTKSLNELKQKVHNVKSTAVILVIEAATTGRASIVYYSENEISVFVDNLIYWYEGCKWFYSVKGQIRSFTPRPQDICNVVYGYGTTESQKKLKKQLARELISAITNRKPISISLVRIAYNKASSPFSFTSNGKWDKWGWMKAVSISCSLTRKYYLDRGEVHTMEINEHETNRDYLFGRLLAIADEIERKAMEGEDQKRPTNAVRAMPMMKNRPGMTWLALRSEKLVPYLEKLAKNNYKSYRYLTSKMDEITSQFELGDIEAKQSLGPRFLEGYSVQAFSRSNKPVYKTNEKKAEED